MAGGLGLGGNLNVGGIAKFNNTFSVTANVVNNSTLGSDANNRRTLRFITLLILETLIQQEMEMNFHSARRWNAS